MLRNCYFWHSTYLTMAAIVLQKTVNPQAFRPDLDDLPHLVYAFV